MDLDKPAILLVGGGEGMGPVEKTVDGVARVRAATCCCCALLLLAAGRRCGWCGCRVGEGLQLVVCGVYAASASSAARLPTAPAAQAIGSECQLVVICGRNARLVERLQKK